VYAPLAPQSPKVGGQVRCFFGTVHRDGTLEHVERNGTANVRLSPGWVHRCPVVELLAIPTAVRTGVQS
jgi:hypothetical protein